MKTKNLIAKLILIVMVVISTLTIFSNRKVQAAYYSYYTDSNGYKWYYVTAYGSSFGYGNDRYVAIDVVVDVGSNYNLTTLTVPSEINGYPVVSIGSWDLITGYPSSNGQYGMVRALTPTITDWDSSSTLPNYMKNASSYCGSYYPKISTVNLPDSVVEISAYAFTGAKNGVFNSYTRRYQSRRYYYDLKFNTFGFSNLTTINMPRRLRSIGKYAFQNTSLSKLELDERCALKTIGDYAFQGCTNLSSVSLSKNISIIGNYAFQGDTKISKVDIGAVANIVSIGDYAFQGDTSLTKFNMNGSSVNSIGNYAFQNTKITDFDFTSSRNLTTIGQYAFNGTKLTGVDFTNNINLTTIGNYAFSGVTTLEGTITIPEKVTTIGAYAFQNTKIDSINVVNSENKFTVGNYAFSGTSIESLTIGSRYQSIGTSAFEGCTALTSVEYTNDCTITEISNKTFYNAPINHLVLSANINKIGDYAFNGSKLVSITIPGTIHTLGSGVFYNSSELETVVIQDAPEGATNVLTEIPAYAFYNTKLSSITFPDAITKIGSNAFQGTKFTSFEIPNTITSIGDSIFYNCEDLTTVTFEENAQITAIPNSAFRNTALSSIVIPDTVTTIGNYAFDNTKLTSFEIPAQITTIGTYAFQNTSLLESVTFETGSVLTAIPAYAFYNSNVSTLEIGPSVTSIGNYAFAKSNIRNLIISGNINSIGTYVFSECENLKRVEFTEESSIETIPSYMFYNSSLEEIVLPEGLKTIGDHAFDGCKIASFSLPSTVTSMGNYAFANTELLKTFNFPETSTLTTINSYLFQNSGIENITIPSYITTISYYSLSGTKIKDITIPNTVTSIGEYAFYKCEDLTEVVFEEDCKVTYFAQHLFHDSGLETIEIPSSITAINQYAFDNTKITTLTIPNSITTLGSYAFENTTELEEVIFEENTRITNIPSYCFYNSGIKSLDLPEGIQKIETYAYCNCKNLSGDITLPDSLRYLGSTNIYASSNYPIFAGCESLSGVFRTGDGVTDIPGGFMDENCTKFDQIILGKNVRNVYTSSYASGYYDIPQEDGTTVRQYIYDQNRAGYDGAFPHLTEIYVDGNPSNVSFQKFWNCKKLESTRTYAAYKYYEYTSLTINTLPGIKVINNETNEEVTTATYRAGEQLKYTIQIDDNYANRYGTIKLYRSTMDGLGGTETVDYDGTVQTMTLAEDGFITVMNYDTRTDLALRLFINKVGNTSLNRIPIQESDNGEFKYLHTKNPYKVNNGQYINYTIRVYNESTTTANANKINIYLPDGLELDENAVMNKSYKWTKTGEGKYTSTYLSNVTETIDNGDGTTTEKITDDRSIPGYTGTSGYQFKDIIFSVRVTAEASSSEDKIFNVIAEIAEESAEDVDSAPGTITEGVGENYRKEERDSSDNTSYLAGVQDDDDFESVKIAGKVKVDYQIKLSKIDAVSRELLKGAKFNLLNEDKEVIDTAYTDENGELDFGTQSSYGAGDITYYIEEAETPEGYIVLQKSKIRLTVHKTIINEDEGTYSISIECDNTDFELDTTKSQYLPITNEEQLKKIGSGENVEVNGTTYTYAPNGYYQLLNDITLATSTNWTPIEGFKGVLKGNNHKISNLLYASSADLEDIGVIGLFGTFEGVIDGVILDNVQIHVNAINTTKVSANGHTGIGAFAGEMVSGTIQNCTVYGNITASTDNIGGFVGHTVEGNITRFINDTFNQIDDNVGIVGSNISKTEDEREATAEEMEYDGEWTTRRIPIIENVSGTNVYTDVTYVTGTAQTTYESTASNIGGIVGCSLGSIELTNCTNNADIMTPKYNGAGLVGYIDATNYRDVTNVKADLDGDVIKLVLENTKATGNYELRLASKDVQTLGLIEGGVYSVLGSDKNVIEGYQNIVIEGESIKIAEVNIDNYGIDTYYIQEETPAPGYKKMDGKIKVEITKYWDREVERFKVRVRVIVLTDEEFENDVPATVSDEDTGSSTGKTYEIESSNEGEGEGTIQLAKKARIEGCKNFGKITGYNNPENVAGIVANVQSKILIDGCENSGEIYYGASGILARTAGIVSEISDLGNTSVIRNTVNKAAVGSYGSSSCKAAGIINHPFTNLIIDGCINEGEIQTSGPYGSVGGIICTGNGSFKIMNSKNKGTLKINAVNQYAWAGGMLAGIESYGYIDWAMGSDDSKYKGMSLPGVGFNNVEIYNCENTGDIYGDQHVGGMAGWVSGGNLIVSNCKVIGTEDEKVKITYFGNGMTGGMVGQSNAYVDKFDSCEVVNTNIYRNVDDGPNVYATAGIIGHAQNEYRRFGSSSDYIYDIQLNNCKIDNTNISCLGSSLVSAGIGFVKETRNLVVTKNAVTNTNLVNAGSTHNPGAHTSGLVADIYQSYITGLVIECSENEVSNVNFNVQNRGAYNYCTSGILSTNYINYNSQYINGQYVYSGTRINANYNKVDNVDFQIPTGICSAVIAATYQLGGGNFCNNEVSNINIHETGGSQSSRERAGILCLGYYNFGPLNVCSNKVTNFHNEYNYGSSSSTNAGGIISSMYIGGMDPMVITHNELENIELLDLGGGSSYIGMAGVLGNRYNNNFSSNNGPQHYDYNKIKNLTIDSKNHPSYGSNFGGIVGFAGADYGQIMTMTNCEIDGIKADISGAFGAYFGLKYGMTDSPSRNIIITNGKVKNVEVNTYSLPDYPVLGGLVGASGSCIFSDIDIENIKIKTYGETYQNIGGIIGHTSNSGFWFTNINMKDVEITGNGSNRNMTMGGFIGGTYTLYNYDNRLTNCTIDNLTLNPGSGTSEVGGFIGETYGTIGFYNCEIKNSELNSVGHVNTNDYNNVGAYVGGGYVGDLEFFGNKINDVNINTYAMYNSGIANYANTVKVRDYQVNNFHINDLRDDSTKNAYAGYNYSVDTLGVKCALGSDKINEFKDIRITNSGITGYATHMNGLSSFCSGETEVDNVVFENVSLENKIMDNYYNSSSLSDSSQHTILLIAELSTNNSSFRNIDVKDVELFSGKGVASVLSDTVKTSEYNHINIENVKLHVQNDHMDSGNSVNVIARVCTNSQTLNDVTIKNVEMNLDKGPYGGTGIISGVSYTSAVLRLNDVKISDVDIVDNATTGSGSALFAGGLAGAIGNIEIANSDIHDINLTVGKPNNADNSMMTMTGGLVGGAYNSNPNTITNSEIYNINILNNTNDMSACLIGQAYGRIMIQDSNIHDIDLKVKKGQNYGRASFVGGLAGFGYNGFEINNSTLNNLSVENENGDHAGGLIGHAYSNDDYKFIDSTVSNIKIANNGTTRGYDWTGGLIGYNSGGNIVYENSTIENIEVENNTPTAVGGLVGYQYAPMTITGSGVGFKNIKVTHNVIDPDATNISTWTGGLVGFSDAPITITGIDKDVETVVPGEEGEEPTVTTEHVHTPINIDGITITNRYGGTSGGLVGFADSIMNVTNAVISNIDQTINVDKVYTSYNDFGGIAGSNEYDLTMNDVVINNNKVVSNISSYMGGISGFMHQSSRPMIHDIEMNNIIVKQEVPYNLFNRTPRAGGITTIINYYDDEDDETDDNTTLENININELAVIAKVYDENNNLFITDQNETGGLAAITIYHGAYMGNSEYTGDPVVISPAAEGTLNIRNVNIKNTSEAFEDGTKKEIFGTGFTGGLLGFGKVNVENVSIDNLDVEGALSTGGVVGHSDSENIINNVTVKNSDIRTYDANRGPVYHTGGVIGYLGHDSLIKNSTVDNVVITNDGYGNVGGLVGLTNRTNATEVTLTVVNSVVKNCVRELENNVKVGLTGKAHVGGFLGFGKINVVNGETEDDYSEVTNCYIAGTRQTNEYDRYGYLNTDVGGFVGNLLANGLIQGARLSDCTIENNKLREKRFDDEQYNYTEYNNHVGTYVGCNEDKLDSNISGCTNSNVTVNMYEL